MKNIMANAIMGGGGTARERLRQRKVLSRDQPQGTPLHLSLFARQHCYRLFFQLMSFDGARPIGNLLLSMPTDQE